MQFEEFCWELGPAVGAQALRRGAEWIEERRETWLCSRCGRAVQRQRSRRVYQTLVVDVPVVWPPMRVSRRNSTGLLTV